MIIINRHCNYSSISANKDRPAWFNREKCFLNLLKTKGESRLVVFFDGDPKGHFVSNYEVEIVAGNYGSGAKSYLAAIDYALQQPDEDIYFVEDDYLHTPGWYSIMSRVVDTQQYVTLYDHPDKYDSMYAGLQSSLILIGDRHWRTTPSTTDTFACKKNILQEDYNIHVKFSSIANYSFDHLRFLELGSKGRHIISPIPGMSTHVETGFLSPFIDWSKI